MPNETENKSFLSSPEARKKRRIPKRQHSVGARGDGDVKFAKLRNPYGKRSFSGQYRVFRDGGLGRADSFFNALYISVCDNSIEREKKRLTKSAPSSADFTENFLDLHPAALRLISGIPYRIRAFFAGIRKKWLSIWYNDGGTKKYKRKRDFLKANILPFTVTALALLVGAYVAYVLTAPVVLYAAIDGELIGVVQNEFVVKSAVNQLEGNVKSILGKDFKFPYPIQYTFETEHNTRIATKNEVSNTLYTYVVDYICTASGLYVDNTLIAVCHEEEEINSILQEMIAEKRAETGDATTDFFNDIMVVNQAYPTDSIISRDELGTLLSSLLIPLNQRNRTASGSVVTMAETEETDMTDFSNSHTANLIADAQFVKKAVPKQKSNQPQSTENILLSFYTMKEMSYQQEIPFSTVYQESAQRYSSMADVTVEGVDGVEDIRALVYYVDGKEARREILSRAVKKQPVTRVISVGTKALPEALGFTGVIGRFIMPRIDILISPYGYREDGMHRALDIAGRDGDNIYAAASGTVVTAIGQNGVFSKNSANYYTGYGYCVVIEHDDGSYSTLYGHCSKICVEMGQYVTQGQKIAEVGITGNAEGYHVHFEIMQGSQRVNPQDGYLYAGTTTIYQAPAAAAFGKESAALNKE